MTKHWSDAQAEAAEARGAELLAHEPRIIAARFDGPSGRVVLDLSNGCVFAFPARRIEGLEDASDEAIGAMEILGVGFALRWPERDVDISLGGLLNGVFGTRDWMRTLAQRAGRARSPAKAAAARANGAKGGRPRKTV